MAFWRSRVRPRRTFRHKAMKVLQEPDPSQPVISHKTRGLNQSLMVSSVRFNDRPLNRILTSRKSDWKRSSLKRTRDAKPGQEEGKAQNRQPREISSENGSDRGFFLSCCFISSLSSRANDLGNRQKPVAIKIAFIYGPWSRKRRAKATTSSIISSLRKRRKEKI